MTTPPDLSVLETAARAGGQILARHFDALASLEVRAKGPADYVSQADLEAELAIQTILMDAAPAASWHGEETPARRGASTLEWVVDPLDGTTNFLSGIPHFGVSIALREAGVAILGVVLAPLADEMFCAARGAGAWRNGEAMRVSTRASMEQLVLTTGVPHRGSPHHAIFEAQLRAVRDRVGGIRRFGSAALDLAWVAAGRFDGFWEQGLNPWDVAAGNLLVEEAGGLVTGLREDHDPHTGASLLAASPWAHERLLPLLGA